MLNLQIEGLTKRFGKTVVLRNISLHAKKGDVLAVIGPSGSGKSSLLRCANLLDNPSEGRIYIMGEELLLKRRSDGDFHASNSRQLQRLRMKIGFVFQDYQLWSHLTILENLIEAPIYVLKQKRDDAIARAHHYLEKMRLLEKTHDYPNQLSGGQRQRVAVARALMIEPEILLFDEPTSSLDPILSAELRDLIGSLAKEGLTILVATHEMTLAREISTHLLFLDRGEIQGYGPTQDVLKLPKIQNFVHSLGREEVHHD